MTAVAKKKRTWHRLHVFPRLAPSACFPALGTVCMFSRAWYRLLDYPRLVPSACLPALGTIYMFPCAWYRLPHVFPRLVLSAYLPALGTVRMFSRTSFRLHVFYRLIPVKRLGFRCQLIVLAVTIVIGFTQALGKRSKLLSLNRF